VEAHGDLAVAQLGTAPAPDQPVFDVLVVAVRKTFCHEAPAVGGLVTPSGGAVGGAGQVGDAIAIGGHRNEERMGSTGQPALRQAPAALADNGSVNAFRGIGVVAADCLRRRRRCSW